MRTGTLAIIVLLLSICVGLAATNPSKQEYGVFLEGVLTQALERMDRAPSRDGGIIREILKSQGRKIIQSLVWSNTVRRNYGLFSIFETRIFEVRVEVLGVGRTFVPLDDMDEVVRSLGRTVLSPAKRP
jgi:hypothetical protein